MRTLFLALILTTAGCSMDSQGTTESALGGHGTDAHAPPDRDGGGDPCKYDGGICKGQDGGGFSPDAGWEPPKDGGGFTGDASWEPPKDGGGSSVDGGHVEPPVDAGGHHR